MSTKSLIYRPTNYIKNLGDIRNFCKNKLGEQGAKFQLLCGSSTATCEGDKPEDKGVDIQPADYDEVQKAIFRLKNNKAAEAHSLPAELFKCGGYKPIYKRD